MLRAERLIAPLPSVAGHRQSLQSRKSGEIRLILVIALIHIPLGLFLYSAPSLALIHPVAAFLVGMYWAVRKRYGLDRVALAAGYIIGAEVLWRMAHVPIYWEFGKYGMAAIMITALIMRRQYTLPAGPLIYGLLLIPACFITLAVFEMKAAAGFLSADMSGPFALVIGCWFFSKTELNVRQLQRLIYTVVIPLLSVAFVTLFYTVSLDNIQFTTESNFATSGGFGPNQVSSMLGLGVFISASCIILFKNGRLFQIVLGTMALLFSAQSVMTFSRSGIYNAVGAMAVLLIFHFQNLADGLKRIVPIAVLVVAFFWFVFPMINNFTGGKLEERFTETNTTNRMDIIWSDLEIFVENPVFGVGVGVSRNYRERYLSYSSASHTEFSRLISEHGSLGLAAVFVLIAMTVINLKRHRSILHRALVMGVSMWCILYMLNAGMRLAAPSFLWGLTFVTVVGNHSKRRRISGPSESCPKQNRLVVNEVIPQPES